MVLWVTNPAKRLSRSSSDLNINSEDTKKRPGKNSKRAPGSGTVSYQQETEAGRLPDLRPAGTRKTPCQNTTLVQGRKERQTGSKKGGRKTFLSLRKVLGTLYQESRTMTINFF